MLISKKKIFQERTKFLVISDENIRGKKNKACNDFIWSLLLLIIECIWIWYASLVWMHACTYVKEMAIYGHCYLLLFLSNLALICIISFRWTFCTFDNSYLFLIVFFFAFYWPTIPQRTYISYIRLLVQTFHGSFTTSSQK